MMHDGQLFEELLQKTNGAQKGELAAVLRVDVLLVMFGAGDHPQLCSQ